MKAIDAVHRLRRSAFTLIELIVVIVLLSLTAAVVYPRLNGGFLASERLRSSLSGLASMAGYARDQAVATRRMQVLTLDLESGAYAVANASAAPAPEPGDTATSATDSGVRGALAEGVRFESVRLPGKPLQPQKIARLRFTPEGWGDPALIQLRGAGGEIHSVVITAPAGRIETYPSAVSDDGTPILDAAK